MVCLYILLSYWQSMSSWCTLFSEISHVQTSAAIYLQKEVRSWTICRSKAINKSTFSETTYKHIISFIVQIKPL